MTFFDYDDEVDTNANVSGQALSPYNSDSDIDSDETRQVYTCRLCLSTMPQQYLQS